MIIHKEYIKEFRPNGSLMYECTHAYLSPLWQHLYDRRIVGEKGAFIRINHATKYKTDGSIEWRLIYDKYGEVVEKIPANR